MIRFRLINFKAFVLLLFVFGVSETDAQLDSAYVEDYSDYLTTRLYSSTKFNRLTVGNKTADENYDYFPNNNINIGLGCTYRGFTLNLGFKAPYINQDNDKKGTTKYFDAQGHMFTKQLAVNFFFQLYRGYYLTNSDELLPDYIKNHNSYYTRNDLRTSNIGISAAYIFNHKKFSYRSTFIQDQWQKKSAGSFLAGLYAMSIWVTADSGIAPLANNIDPTLNLDQSTLFSIGPEAGYAYNFIIKEHFFITGSALLGFGYDYSSRRYSENNANKWAYNHSLSFKVQYRFGIGYNSHKHYIGITYEVEDFSSSFEESYIKYDVGTVRINFVKRFNYQPPFIDKVMDFVRYKVLNQKDE